MNNTQSKLVKIKITRTEMKTTVDRINRWFVIETEKNSEH